LSGVDFSVFARRATPPLDQLLGRRKHAWKASQKSHGVLQFPAVNAFANFVGVLLDPRANPKHRWVQVFTALHPALALWDHKPRLGGWYRKTNAIGGKYPPANPGLIAKQAA